MPNFIKEIDSLKYAYPYLIESEILSFLDLFEVRSLDKGNQFVLFGERKKYLFWILKGLLKAYYYDEKEEQVIVDFYKENNISPNLHSTISGDTSKLCIEAIEPTVIIRAEIKKIEKFAATNLNILRLYNDILKRKWSHSLEYIYTNMHTKPEGRYLRLKQEQPDLLRRVSQKDMASYMGITQVSFSRIKKRIKLSS